MLRRIQNAVVVIGLLTTATLVWGQVPQGPYRQVNISGTISAIGRGKIQVNTPQNGQWIIDLSNRTSVMVTGKGNAAMLQPGMFVKFQAEIAGRDKITSPVDRIQVFTPTRQDVPGVFPVKTPPAIGINPQNDATQKPPAKQPALTTYDIVGRITGIQKGHMVVSFGRGTVQVQPAANLEVELAINDIRYAQLGDKVVCLGMITGPGNARTIRATSVQVTHGLPARPDPKDIAWPMPPTKKTSKQKEDPQAKSDRLVQWLTPRKKTSKKESFQIENDPTVFQVCHKRSATSLLREYGLPKKQKITGTLTIRDRSKSVKWELWTWGPVKVIIDRSHKARFFAVEKVEKVEEVKKQGTSPKTEEVKKPDASPKS